MRRDQASRVTTVRLGLNPTLPEKGKKNQQCVCGSTPKEAVTWEAEAGGSVEPTLGSLLKN